MHNPFPHPSQSPLSYSILINKIIPGHPIPQQFPISLFQLLSISLLLLLYSTLPPSPPKYACLYAKWHYNQLQHICSRMTSPYSTRSRNTVGVLQPHLETLKMQELSPKTSTRPTRSSANTPSIKVSVGEKLLFLTPQVTRSMKDPQIKAFGEQELLNLDPSYSSNNDDSGGRQKSSKKQSEGDRPEHNLSSMGLEQNSLFASLQIEKTMSKKSDDGFINEKKSYRTQFHRRTVGVPYRKCHSSMEEKVVAIINKIKSGKECHKEIETLIDRTRKISTKEMMNRYVVSGIQVIRRLAAKHHLDKGLLSSIEDCLEGLKHRIEAELDCPRMYQVSSASPKKPELPREKLILRVFNLLRKRNRKQEREEAHRQAIETTQWLMEQPGMNLESFLARLVLTV